MKTIRMGDAYGQLDEKNEPVLRACQLCGRAAAYFVNTGFTHCLGCEAVEELLNRARVVEVKEVAGWLP